MNGTYALVARPLSLTLWGLITMAWAMNVHEEALTS